jgi:hypothetical protein
MQHKALLPFLKKVIVAIKKLCCEDKHILAPFQLLRTLYHQWWNFASGKYNIT